MQKVPCSACGMMNLDKFVTYPHCAGCGTRLPEVVAPRLIDFWRRPLGAPMWATIIGFCCALLAIATVSSSRDTRTVGERQLVVYSQIPRTVQLGERSALQLTFDTTEADNNLSVQSFDDVRVRVPRSTLNSFELGAVSPKPDEERVSGSGQYLVFKQLGREQSIRIGLRSQHIGPKKVELSLYVRDFSPFEVRSVITVTPLKRPQVPH